MTAVKQAAVQPAVQPTTLADIDKAAAKYSDARATLTDLVNNLQALQDALSRQHMPAIRKAVQAAAEKHDQLKTMIEDAPHLFEKPKSQTMHGIKAGYRKGSGKMEFSYDDEKTIELIRKHLSEDEVDGYIITSEAPNKKALAELDGKKLKALGVHIESTGEVAFIKPVDGAVDKIVKALIKEATEA